MTNLPFRVRELWINDKAVAATEFAIVVPFMLLLYIGGIELGNGMAINVKVTAVAHSVADMVSQNTQVSTAQMQNILGAATAILAPYPTTDSSGNSLYTVTVSEVSTDGNGNATVQWSQSYNGSTYGAGRATGNFTLPSSLTGAQNYNSSFILGEVSYAYKPNLGYTISGTVTLTDNYYMFPRCSTNSPANASFPYYDVKLTASTTCDCIQHLQQKTC
ncbi:TadE/TadG family type IV pilus assembly protein [Bradyrhizobium sp. Tv2a-2]|uniref:TadE/TadG family type IV pilus assembly protein n=1 Tax=Bradyrhizobium sp. Tv2a-2 TaxID=113395 RepID=UPI0004224B01|nr:TadE/TadG family type IV pilus assembly protein [Bradyrhizobium sp. Tv2a-2]